MLIRSFAFLSGVPALVYQVAWTREVALVAGSQIEAISAVLVAFFGGLALGARAFGGVADRAASPLRLYGALEISAGALAALSLPLLRWLGGAGVTALSAGGRLAGAVAILLPVTLLLGGTLPALLRASVRELPSAARHAGGIAGWNTAGSVLGVVAAVALIPRLGLRATLLTAALTSLAIGVAALACARGTARPRLTAGPESTAPGAALLAAGVAGVATLAFEVLAARMAALQLDSSLYAWGAVLSLTLLGLASGNLALARRAAGSDTPLRDLGRLEAAAAVAIAGGLTWLAPAVAAQAPGLGPRGLLAVAIGVLPAAFCMGGAFPFFVRLSVRTPELGAAFGAVSAVNTAGGIAGALLAPFALLPAFGLVGGALLCAALNGALAAAFLWSGNRGGRRLAELGAAGAALLAASLAAAAAGGAPDGPGAPRVIHVAHGRQASVAVVLEALRRDLIVDGDPEASTGSEARATEELLAVLPLLLHPDPRSFLEVGFGSGITLGTAARFPLERIECVEIASAVLSAAPYFAPENGEIASGRDPRVHIVHADGRAHLLRRVGEFDVVVANTLHPWSLGATGLYSREYFARLAGALRPGGLAVQWLPFRVLGGDHLAAILRSFYGAFAHGALWWGSDNVLLMGSDRPVPRIDAARFDALAPRIGDVLGRLWLDGARSLEARRIASAERVLAVLGPGLLLSDDRPVLEARAARRQPAGAAESEIALIERIARAGTREDPTPGELLLWIEAQAARVRGEEERARRLEAVAEAAGFALGRRARLRRDLEEARQLNRAGRSHEASALLEAAAGREPGNVEPKLAQGLLAFEQGRRDAARRAFEAVVAESPESAVAWNNLGLLRQHDGDPRGAAEAFERALAAAPFFPQAHANAGLLALRRGDRASAQEHLRSLGALSPLGSFDEERALARALAGAE